MSAGEDKVRACSNAYARGVAEREWTVADAERLLMTVSRMSGVTQESLDVVYEELQDRHPGLPAWQEFLSLLEQSRFADLAQRHSVREVVRTS